MTNSEFQKKLDLLENRVKKLEEAQELKCKFKVGDSVKVINKKSINYGNIVTIVQQPAGHLLVYMVRLENGEPCAFAENELELHIEPFTDDEKVILRNLPDEFKWIARDSDDYLAIFTTKPRKDCEYSVWLGGGDVLCLKGFNHIFQSIKWEDDEPCEFRKYL